MKLVKNFLFAALLLSAIAVNTSAGIQDTPGFANPTPSPTPENAIATSDGETAASDPNAGSVTTVSSDYLFIDALAALLSIY